MLKTYGVFFVVLISFLKITTASLTDTAADDGAVSLNEAIDLKQGLLRLKQRLESKDTYARRKFISEEWDYITDADGNRRPRHKPTGKIIYKERKPFKHSPFLDHYTKKRKRRKDKKKKKNN